MGLGSALLTLILLAFAYLFPACVASGRDHRNSLAIFVFNLLLGWSGIGWVLALVWACTANVRGAEGGAA